MNKKLWIVANFKSNKTLLETVQWVEEVGPKVPKDENLTAVVCPLFSQLAAAKKAVMVEGSVLQVGSQDISAFAQGAYTGEEPAVSLKELVTFSIVGHSERRSNFSENDEQISRKCDLAIQNDIIPILCVQGKDTPVPNICKIIAYEPVFAIGTGTPDTPENANEVAGALKEKYGEDLKVLYGGSVNSQNCKGFVSQMNIDGLLIGKSSLDAQEFIRTINECAKV